jgi:hypothetical protein
VGVSSRSAVSRLTYTTRAALSWCSSALGTPRNQNGFRDSVIHPTVAVEATRAVLCPYGPGFLSLQSSHRSAHHVPIRLRKKPGHHLVELRELTKHTRRIPPATHRGGMSVVTMLPARGDRHSCDTLDTSPPRVSSLFRPRSPWGAWALWAVIRNTPGN